MKTGLVLEGGAMRGMYTAGVLDMFLENQISVDVAAGVSAGALFGVNFLSGQKGRVIRYNKRFNHDKDYLGLRPLLREGNIVSTQLAYRAVPRVLDPFDDESFQKSGVPFYAVVTNMESGEAEYHLITSVFRQMDTLRASGSMPFVSKPVEIGGQLYLDGAISDSIPFQWLAGQGCDKLIVLLTRDADYRKKPMPRILTGLYASQYPRFSGKLQNRHLLYNQSIELLRKWEQEGKAFVIRPSRPIEISRTESDPRKLQDVYDLGIHDGIHELPRLKEYLRS